MNINLPPNVRQLLYVAIAISSPVMAYLNQTDTISDFVFGLFSVIVTAVAGLAAYNVKR